jgi:hypothetical protein
MGTAGHRTHGNPVNSAGVSARLPRTLSETKRSLAGTSVPPQAPVLKKLPSALSPAPAGAQHQAQVQAVFGQRVDVSHAMSFACVKATKNTLPVIRPARGRLFRGVKCPRHCGVPRPCQTGTREGILFVYHQPRQMSSTRGHGLTDRACSKGLAARSSKDVVSMQRPLRRRVPLEIGTGVCNTVGTALPALCATTLRNSSLRYRYIRHARRRAEVQTGLTPRFRMVSAFGVRR